MATAFILRRDEKEGFQDPGRPGSHGGWTVADPGGLPWSFFHGTGEAELRLAWSRLWQSQAFASMVRAELGYNLVCRGIGGQKPSRSPN